MPPADTTPDDPDLDAGLRTSRPPSRFALVRRFDLDTTAQLHDLRAGLQAEINARAHAAPERGLDHVADRLVLVASELATNAIRHGRPPTLVELYQDGARFLLAVTDHDPSSAPVVAGPRAPGNGGFGLQIARRLAVDVGWYRTDDAKVVWAEIGG